MASDRKRLTAPLDEHGRPKVWVPPHRDANGSLGGHWAVDHSADKTDVHPDAEPQKRTPGMSDDKRVSMREMQDKFDSIIDEVASACGVFGSAVEIIINRTDASGQVPPWRIRVYVESKTARIYKQRTIDGDGATVEDAARSAIDNVVQNVLGGSIQTRNGLRSDIVSDFKDRMKKAAADNDQRSLISMLIEINGWTTEEAMDRILKIKQYDDPNRNEKIWKTK